MIGLIYEWEQTADFITVNVQLPGILFEKFSRKQNPLVSMTHRDSRKHNPVKIRIWEPRLFSWILFPWNTLGDRLNMSARQR